MFQGNAWIKIPSVPDLGSMPLLTRWVWLSLVFLRQWPLVGFNLIAISRYGIYCNPVEWIYDFVCYCSSAAQPMKNMYSTTVNFERGEAKHVLNTLIAIVV